MNPPESRPLTPIQFAPIGVVHSPHKRATGTPIQPCLAGESPGHILLREEFAAGLADLAGFDRIWLIYWFDRAAAAKMRVVPYGDSVEHGLFATRAPARPNPIGLSCVRLLSIEGPVLKLAEVDILDGTPLLDIKPYSSIFDCFPDARNGWQERVDKDTRDKLGRRGYRGNARWSND